jgi:nitroreductase
MIQNDTILTLIGRRSIRTYKQEQITDEELQTILVSGTFAPSGMDSQPWRFQ